MKIVTLLFFRVFPYNIYLTAIAVFVSGVTMWEGRSAPRAAIRRGGENWRDNDKNGGEKGQHAPDYFRRGRQNCSPPRALITHATPLVLVHRKKIINIEITPSTKINRWRINRLMNGFYRAMH